MAVGIVAAGAVVMGSVAMGDVSLEPEVAPNDTTYGAPTAPEPAVAPPVEELPPTPPEAPLTAMSSETGTSCVPTFEAVAVQDLSNGALYPVERGADECAFAENLGIEEYGFAGEGFTDAWGTDPEAWPGTVCDPVPGGECREQS